MTRWLEDAEAPDPDTGDDLRYVEMFIDNILARNTGVERPQSISDTYDPWPVD